MYLYLENVGSCLCTGYLSGAKVATISADWHNTGVILIIVADQTFGFLYICYTLHCLYLENIGPKLNE